MKRTLHWILWGTARLFWFALGGLALGAGVALIVGTPWLAALVAGILLLAAVVLIGSDLPPPWRKK